ncbi:MAG: hypothetical protein ABI688_01880 [Bacteroidota bacterium]
MKKLLLLLFFAAGLGCQKSSSDNRNQLTGRWELRRSEGGIAGTIVYPPGSGLIYSFNANNRFTYSSNGAVSDSGTFTLTPLPAGQWSLELRSVLVNSTTIIPVTINKTQLIFLAAMCCVDIPTLTFSKI